METETKLGIRELNDEARHYLADGLLVLSAGVGALFPEEQAAIINRVCDYNDFTPENDPYGEHDFGMFEHAGECIVWKIDYYDQSGHEGQVPDMADRSSTRRVITVMLAEEY